jgi:hypothetical protein
MIKFSIAMLTEPGWVDWELAKYSVTFEKSTSTYVHREQRSRTDRCFSELGVHHSDSGGNLGK